MILNNTAYTFLFVFIYTVLFTQTVSAQDRPARTVFVQLVEWRWADIAQECEDQFGPLGFAGVLVSPPNEHVDHKEDTKRYRLDERYQPVSYTLVSRSGTRAEFRDMVTRCHAAGVQIYVDAVINNMTEVIAPGITEVGLGGTEYGHYTYKDYQYEDFHHETADGRRNKPVEEWHYRKEGGCASCLRDYELDERADLKTETEKVRETLAAYLNDLISLHVDGFCFDAAQHVRPDDISDLLFRMNSEFGDLFVCQEVADDGERSVKASEYFRNGSVTELKYAKHLAEVFRDGQLKWLRNFGTQWGMMPNNKAVVFINDYTYTHIGDETIHFLTYDDERLYILANVFMLAWPYGYPKVVSGYVINGKEHGPPRDEQGIKPVWVTNEDGTARQTCFVSGSEWKCVHRWRHIYNMVDFRNYTADAWMIDNWWDNGNNQIAFGRGDKGFVVINRESSALDQWLQTGLPAGIYCDITHGDYVDGRCVSGRPIKVDDDGRAHFVVNAMDAVAIHVGAKQQDEGIQGEADWQRTVVFVFGETDEGQDMFMRGGIDHDYAASSMGLACTNTNYECAIPIRHLNLRNLTTVDWKDGDKYLDWYGTEPRQGGYPMAMGTPLDWTTNAWPPEWGAKRLVAVDGFGEEPLNRWGNHYWMLDVEMDCSKTADGWFEFRSFISNGPGWENDIHQSDTPYQSPNHFAKCGSLNAYKRNEDEPLTIEPLP